MREFFKMLHGRKIFRGKKKKTEKTQSLVKKLRYRSIYQQKLAACMNGNMDRKQHGTNRLNVIVFFGPY